MTVKQKEKKKRTTHVGPYEIGRTLGHGSFGKVKLGTNVYTQEKVAIKFFRHKKLCNQQQVESSKREIEIMKLLKHPHIVKLIDVIERPEQGTTYLVVEYVSGGELFDYIVANGMVKEKEARRFMRQIISAVEYCHSNLVVHRDLKPENMLLDSDGNIKISDFGLSNMIEPGKLLDSFCGSPLYAAPEILLAERYVGPPVDVWSIGVILYAVLCGHLPWSGDNQAEISYHSTRGIYEEPSHLSASARILIRKMLTPNPKLRLTIDQLRQHPWVNEGFAEPPPSLLVVRTPVVEVRETIMGQLAQLGFTNKDDVTRRILANECCQVVAIYHLLLDRAVDEEMNEVKRSVSKISPRTPCGPGLPKKSNSNSRLACIQEDDEGNSASKTTHKDEMRISGDKMSNGAIYLPSTSPQQDFHMMASSPMALQPPPMQHMQYQFPPLTQAQQQAQQQGPVPMQIQQQHVSTNPFLSATTAPVEIVGGQPQNRVLRVNAQQRTNSHHGPVPNTYSSNGNMLAQSMPIPFSAPVVPTRRFSVSGIHGQSDPVSYFSSEDSAMEPPLPPMNGALNPPSLQQQDPQAPPASYMQRRRYSLDSRAQQMSTENPQQQQSGAPSAGGPRLVKGIFKAATTSTKTPEETSKLVKKLLSNMDGFFVKRKTPYVFECIDECSNVKFQLEVCKIQQLDMTGIHLKRISGDIWQYKNLCTEIVEQMKL